jgi:nucleoside phosphorylase
LNNKCCLGVSNSAGSPKNEETDIVTALGCRISVKNCSDELAERENLNKLVDSKLISVPTSLKVGPIASGSIVGASLAFAAWLKRTDRNYLAIQMDAGGVLAAIYERTDPSKVLVIRGISDFGDKRKSALDQYGGGVFRKQAMRNSVRLFTTLMECGLLPRHIPV